ncbi:hypothetical protein LOTGIDRAFT_133988 [Lottia gigantea]|uniref:AAA+ ATPase domain-containing protein n=1 Tax=Lottia gigantea TaxID=225164 RepID=V4B3T3_LOTGI|nr:hypothetical protein LOTGIDRAFT_133988 [Lottia gigantea]ESO83049.1 hypothetical protein LOTGIDRAFT_133988 [Lottia gigantea]
MVNTQIEKTLSWNEFVSDLMLKGEVDQIHIVPGNDTVRIKLHQGAIFQGKPVLYPYMRLQVADTTRLEEKIRKIEQDIGVKVEDQVSISYWRPGATESIGAMLIVCGILAMVLMLLGRSLKKMPTDMMGGMQRAKFVRVDVQSQQNKDKAIRFKDVAGLREAKQEMLEFVDYLKTPDRYKELGAKIPRGAILLGPPGCGKTLLARAVASEAGVPFLAMAGSEFVEMIGGVGAARVRDLFKEAKKKAPCIVYLDEIDAIGRKRGGGPSSSSEEESTLNQLLVEMDGMETNKGVIMLASTNRADVLDNALLRRGRFDRHITIDLPTMIERREIFEMYTKKLKTSTSAESLSPKLAQLSPGMSADIANVCNEAAIHAARYSKTIIEPVDFQHALERIIAGAAKRSRLLSPSEKKVVAYHESGHALVGWMLKYTDALLRISIVPRTNNALGFTQFLPQDKKLYSKQELFERMCMALGGRAAEVIIFNQTTTGARDDLDRVTKLAFEQIRSYGMNENIGPIAFPAEAEGSITGGKPYSKKLAATMDEEARAMIAHAFSKTVELLEANKDKLHKLSGVLLEKEVLNYEEIKKLIGPPPFGEKNTIETIGWEGDLPSPDTIPATEPRKDAEI